MANHRKRRKKSVKKNIKYEIYGIAMIVLSIISLASPGPIPGMGSVGRAFSYIDFMLAGHFYFVVPLICIYIGLFLMIRRGWPKKWSYKKTGVALLVIGLTMLAQINLFEEKDPGQHHLVSDIMANPIHNVMDYLSTPKEPLNVAQFKNELGGGLVGGFFYGCLYFLFDDRGSKFIAIALFMVSFMLITGISLADIGLMFKGKLGGAYRNAGKRFSEMLRLLKEQPKKSASKSKSAPAVHSPASDEMDEKDVNTHRERGPKKPSFFSLFGSKNKDTVDDDEEDAAFDPQALEPTEEVVYQAEDQNGSLPNELHAEDADHARPVIRDFQEHVDRSLISGRTSDVPQLQPPSSMLDGLAFGEDAQTVNMFVEEKPQPIPYQLPPLNLLSRPANGGKGADGQDFKANARKLEATLESFGVRARVLEVVRGPAVTRYEIQPDTGVKVSRIVSLTDDIALALAAKDIRMEAPIPGKSAIGIEVPNMEVAVVTMREVMESAAFQDAGSKLSVVLGRDISGQPIVGNLARMPHLLVAGATGSGKSVCINGIITSILYKAKPEEVKFLMIDPKMVELNVYNGIPHLLAPVVTDPRRASLALKKIVSEMEKRYEAFSKSGTRNMEGYNAMLVDKGEAPLPYIVVIVDELADLMMVAANDVEDAICRLAQMARAAGIHLIIATQRPSVDVITGVIKANIPSRIAFGVSSQVDSRTILDAVGAEKLLGRGDMLYLPVGASKPTRIQGAFLSDQEVEAVVQYSSTQGKAEYREEMVPELDESVVNGQEEFVDELFDQAVNIILEAKQASVSLLQRRMRVGYTRAARLIDAMEAKGIVGPYEGSKPREVLISLEQYHLTKIGS